MCIISVDFIFFPKSQSFGFQPANKSICINRYSKPSQECTSAGGQTPESLQWWLISTLLHMCAPLANVLSLLGVWSRLRSQLQIQINLKRNKAPGTQSTWYSVHFLTVLRP